MQNPCFTAERDIQITHINTGKEEALLPESLFSAAGGPSWLCLAGNPYESPRVNADKGASQYYGAAIWNSPKNRPAKNRN